MSGRPSDDSGGFILEIKIYDTCEKNSLSWINVNVWSKKKTLTCTTSSDLHTTE